MTKQKESVWQQLEAGIYYAEGLGMIVHEPDHRWHLSRPWPYREPRVYRSLIVAQRRAEELAREVDHRLRHEPGQRRGAHHPHPTPTP